MVNNKKTFIRVTNQDIADKIDAIDRKLGKINVKANVNSAVIALLTLIVCAIVASIIA